MKTISIIAALCTLAAAIDRDECHENNCLRAVGYEPSVPSKVADCNSFFSVTITPTAGTTTVTSTEYSISGNVGHYTVKKRIVTPINTPITVTATAIPGYATKACTFNNKKMAARYSSACSCAGATHATTIVANPAQVTSYTTKTVTVSSFKIKASATALSPPVQFMKPDTNTAGPNYLGIFFTPTDSNDGTNVWRMFGGLLETYQGQFTQQDSMATSQWIWVDYPTVIVANGWIYVDFIVDPVTLALTAVNTQTGNSILQICNIAVTNVPYLDLSAVAGRPEQIGNEPCHPVSLTIVPLP